MTTNQFAHKTAQPQFFSFFFSYSKTCCSVSPGAPVASCSPDTTFNNSGSDSVRGTLALILVLFPVFVQFVKIWWNIGGKDSTRPTQSNTSNNRAFRCVQKGFWQAKSVFVTRIWKKLSTNASHRIVANNW